ncbi:hypothetical protein IHQ68_00200 [Chelatococcus sambhunathii]|uniref:Uncharacterized protein n=1 Tax=Chelatococcus sambhunathii TaxID=363953 RepID=A0ABU1DAB0_9HYPH|nr:hypothetical protein [Chelatococcus sambhunathii]MDR4305048.1 hypothetical protein [Chelatococcus sambhunathii]
MPSLTAPSGKHLNVAEVRRHEGATSHLRVPFDPSDVVCVQVRRICWELGRKLNAAAQLTFFGMGEITHLPLGTGVLGPVVDRDIDSVFDGVSSKRKRE